MVFAVTNIVIRFTVFRMYSDLRQKGVEISSRSFFDRTLLDEEIKEKYPNNKDLILRFIKYAHFAMTFATVLIALILLFGYLLLKAQ
ncbi:MAG: hypothetical protein V3V00_05230 [Saprospiraceae bacterium]